MVEVPHHVITPPSIQRHVQVVGGSNWDLSRSAIATPVRLLPDPVPVRPERDESSWSEVQEPRSRYSAADGIPASVPVVTNFAEGKSTVLKADVRSLKTLTKKKKYVVVGHASVEEASPSTLAWSRAKSVAAALKKQGYQVAAVKAFGSDRPASARSGAENRRVEVYGLPK